MESYGPDVAGPAHNPHGIHSGFFCTYSMPRRTKTPCRHRGCPELVDIPGYCAKHASEGAAWKKRNNAPKRITGRRLQKLRDQLFADDPLCAECRRHGMITPATQRDHIIPLSEGGTDDISNIQGLCHDCHKAKTERESQRGRVRGGVGQIFG
ncbi:HNH endonuclease [Azonexus caeni]|uniref:HNH endonuclease n=1 Tax=Azonexus caeni TaxID=266126 RepID=UPI003A8A2652